MKPEIRESYFKNKYVIITPGRAKRPVYIKEKPQIDGSRICPFCPKNINKKNVLDRINDGKNEVLCIKNIFPAVTLDNKKAFGSQEVIIETTNHTRELSELTLKEIEMVLKMYAKRTGELSKNKKIDYILCFKNQGPKAGASIIHTHSQIFATGILPPEIMEEQRLAKAYRDKNKRCPYCDIIRKEEKSKRKIISNEYFFAFAPFASEYHYESWVFTKRHVDNISKLTNNELCSLAVVLKKILIKLHKLDLSFNFFLHQIISDGDQHFCLKIQPRDSIWAGVELGSGFIINTMPPETAAKYLKK